MDFVIYQRAAASDRLRLWVGVFGAAAPSAPGWQLDGAAREPVALHALGAARTGDLAPPAGALRAFTGVYEFSGLTPDTRYTVTLQVGGERRSQVFRTLPAAVPNLLDQWFNVLIVSCFYQAEDVGGVAGTVISQLGGASQPHLTLLMGDQVYLDLPTHFIFPSSAAALAEKFETDYRRNWLGPEGYARILAAAPSLLIPDDHEYWNNYPSTVPYISNTWTAGGRDNWQRAAQAMYNAFQHSYAEPLGSAHTLDIAPLSFFLADGRTGRDRALRGTLSPAELAELDRWVQHVIDQKLYGVFVSGQTLLAEPAGMLTGAVADYELTNYGDYAAVVHALTRLVDAGRDVLCLTGDVHWGRMTEVRDQVSGRIALREIIASPASLVAMPVADQIAGARSAISRWFGGTPNPWPRHPDPKRPPAYFASQVAANRFACVDPTTHMQRGNHAAMLSFRQSGGGLDMRVTYYPLSLDTAVRQPAVLGPFRLRM